MSPTSLLPPLVSCRVSLATSGRRFLGSLRSPRYLLPSVARPSGHEEKEKGEGRGVEGMET